MSKKSVTKKNYLPMFFRLNMSVDGSKCVETSVSIDFNKGVICFTNPETPVFYAKQYALSLPDFFNIRAICIGIDDFDESVLEHVSPVDESSLDAKLL